ncbi:MAG: Jag N-terminal domain-containing protein [Actinomycetota bacterium]|nr:Jag N-terminal domain-containing protein [Actinomycetota bacterium]
MEWVETTGRTVEEAKDAALDRLGVDERDAEFDVIEEARSGLFGRVRQEARIRARVRPDHPRPRVDRRDRKRRGSETTPATSDSGAEARGRGRAPSGGVARRRPSPDRAPAPPRDHEDDGPGPTPEEQGEDARIFLDGLAEVFGLVGVAEVSYLDDDQIEARLIGEDLGLLIGPKGQTLAAVQDLTRAVVQRGPRRGARLRVDVGGYQERRRAALVRFARQIAEQVQETGVAVSMEPMPAFDRKMVHDTVNTLDGVRSRSEGEDPRRQVLVLPDDVAD